MDWGFERLSTLGMEGDSTAESLLRRAARQVAPIMRRRRWRVTVLAEMFPPQPGLLGLNRYSGAIIELRLRHLLRPTEFLPYECVLDTLLHELVHNEVGPHNEAFYALLRSLDKECRADAPNGPQPGGCEVVAGELPIKPFGSGIRNAAPPPTPLILLLPALDAADDAPIKAVVLDGGFERATRNAASQDSKKCHTLGNSSIMQHSLRPTHFCVR